jgi:hypothetical protein
MSSVVTGRDFLGEDLVRLVADLVVFLGSGIVEVAGDGLTFAAGMNIPVSNARVCALPSSGADRSYLWMCDARVCALPSPVREVS